KSGQLVGVPGTNTTFTTVVTNAGPSFAAGVTVTDPTPAGLTFVSNAGACTTAFPCVVNLAAGTSATITTTYAIPPTYTTPDPIVNTASATSTLPDPATANNSATAMTAITAPVADLQITKDDGVTEVRPGQTVTYTITVTNNGPSTATNAVVTDNF